MSGILYVVATPIGNLEDITLRAVRILKEVDAVVAEDTRQTMKLMSHLLIQKKLISYFEYSGEGKALAILRMLEEGQNLAIVTDAGTPTVSDPGARLIAMAYEKGIQVMPIPGPSAMVSALSVSGFPTDPLHFWGFMSPSPQKRKKIYRKIVEMEGTHCLYVSPHKLEKMLGEWKEFIPEYFFFVAKEITKKFETFWRGKLEVIAPEIIASQIRGEFTVLMTSELL